MCNMDWSSNRCTRKINAREKRAQACMLLERFTSHFRKVSLIHFNFLILFRPIQILQASLKQEDIVPWENVESYSRTRFGIVPLITDTWLRSYPVLLNQPFLMVSVFRDLNLIFWSPLKNYVSFTPSHAMKMLSGEFREGSIHSKKFHLIL